MKPITKCRPKPLPEDWLLCQRFFWCCQNLISCLKTPVCAKRLQCLINCARLKKGGVLIHSIAKRISIVLVRHNASEEANRDIYEYAWELILSTALNVIICLLVSLAYKKCFRVFCSCCALPDSDAIPEDIMHSTIGVVSAPFPGYCLQLYLSLQSRMNAYKVCAQHVAAVRQAD